MKLRKKQRKFFLSYWPMLLFTFFVANYVITRSAQLYFYAQSCMTKEQVSSDSRCLYIYGTQIYQMGSSSSVKHHGHTCGSDITSVLPPSHSSNMIAYLNTDRLVATVCSDTPAPTNTPVPTNTPLPTNTPIPSNTPVPTTPPQPTNTLVPTQPPAGQSPVPTKIPSPTVKKVTIVKTPTPQRIEPSSTQAPVEQLPTPTYADSGFGSSKNVHTAANFKPIPDFQPQTSIPWQPIVATSQLMVVMSFIVMLVSFMLGIIRKKS